ncbi:MAG TPA: ribonuclease HII [Coriobacteriia bacterium]|nr:MAG: Ribonuclease HII [Actinobacteria bacterium 66_15]HAL29139.1 ribonuclease HII [Coriobacteriia bacterium]
MDTSSVTTVVALLTSADVDHLPSLLERFSQDDRPGVVAAVGRAHRRLERALREAERLDALARVEIALMDGGLLCVAGVDEVGRGALAGPVSACACVLPRETCLPGLTDSKRLSAQARERLDRVIREQALGLAVAHVGPDDIDRLGIAQANLCAMRDAVNALSMRPDRVLVDGLPVLLGPPCTAYIGGDRHIRAIAAASIVAKVARDRLMVELDARFPDYGFAGNKGYGSPSHLEALERLGPSPVHRRSFAPCSAQRLF